MPAFPPDPHSLPSDAFERMLAEKRRLLYEMLAPVPRAPGWHAKKAQPAGSALARAALTLRS